MWLNWLEHRYAVHWNVVGSIPCQGTNLKPRFQGWIPGPGSHSIFLSLIDVSFLLFFFFKILFIYFSREGKWWRKRGRETLMHERYIGQLPLTHPQRGTWPATRACALTRNRKVTFQFSGWCSIHWATPAGTHIDVSFSFSVINKHI